MKPAALALFVAITAPGALGQTRDAPALALSSADIISSIPGGWVYGPESDEPGICSEGEHRIWLVRDADDRLIFHESWTGVQLDPTKPRKDHAQGVARMLPLGPDPAGPGALAVRYDGEKRVMPDGDLVEWLLIMPDKESFYWQRRDQTADDRTAASIRCPSSRRPAAQQGGSAAPTAPHSH